MNSVNGTGSAIYVMVQLARQKTIFGMMIWTILEYKSHQRLARSKLVVGGFNFDTFDFCEACVEGKH